MQDMRTIIEFHLMHYIIILKDIGRLDADFELQKDENGFFISDHKRNIFYFLMQFIDEDPENNPEVLNIKARVMPLDCLMEIYYNL